MLRAIGLIWPIPALYAVAWANTEGHLSFGGSDKDLAFLLQLGFLTALYWSAFVACWIKRVPAGNAVGISLGTAVLVFCVLVVGLIGLAMLGVDPFGTGLG
ncbi:MAG: hypothetical protein ACR2PO_20000 [Methyloligellaceae bacterium]